MATLQSTSNMPVFQADNDTARTTQNIKLAGVVICGSSGTAQPTVQLMNGASTLYLIPNTVIKSGLGMWHIPFDPPLEIVGLKATKCTNARMVALLK